MDAGSVMPDASINTTRTPFFPEVTCDLQIVQSSLILFVSFSCYADHSSVVQGAYRSRFDGQSIYI